MYCRKANSGVSLVSSDHLHFATGGLFRKWLLFMDNPTGLKLRGIISANSFIFYQYKLKIRPDLNNLVTIQADPQNTGHILMRPPIAIVGNDMEPNRQQLLRAGKSCTTSQPRGFGELASERQTYKFY